MKKFILSLFAAIAVLFTIAQSPDETAARTLGLPSCLAKYHNYWITGVQGKDIVITRYVDAAKSKKDSTKMVNGAWRYSYSNAPDSFEVKIVNRDTNYFQSSRYLFNFLNGKLDYPGATISALDPFTITRTGTTTDYGWTGTSTRILQEENGNLYLYANSTLGLANNVIPKVFVKRVNGVDTYKEPVDYKGRTIVGEPIYNAGATPRAINIHKNNRYLRVEMTTVTTVGSGLFTTSNPVWTGGVKTVVGKPSLVYISLAELLDILNLTEEELSQMLTVKYKCTPKDPSKFIVSTSSEIVQNGNSYTGITYYNGISTKNNPPSGKITSYEKQYPGHVVRWIFEAEGITGARGGYQIAQFKSSEDNTIKVEYGSKYGYNAATRTFTYDRPGRLVFEYEEGSMLTAQGKGHGNRIYVELE